MLVIKLKKNISDKVKSFLYENNMTVLDAIVKILDSVELNK